MFFIIALLYVFLPSLYCVDFFHSFFPSYLSSFFFSFSPHLPDPRRGAGGQKSLHFLKPQTFILKDTSWKYKKGRKTTSNSQTNRCQFASSSCLWAFWASFFSILRATNFRPWSHMAFSPAPGVRSLGLPWLQCLVPTDSTIMS